MQAKSLTEQELNTAVSYALHHTGKWGQRNRMLLLVSHWTGMRVCEVASLRLHHVLDIRGEVVPELELTANETKGRHSRRVVLPQKLQNELRLYIRRQLNLKSLAGVAYHQGHVPLFSTQKHSAFTANVLTQVYSRLYSAAGIKGATSHSGRRSFITNLAARGANPRALQVLAAHRSLNTTMRYIDVNDSLLRVSLRWFRQRCGLSCYTTFLSIAPTPRPSLIANSASLRRTPLL